MKKKTQGDEKNQNLKELMQKVMKFCNSSTFESCFRDLVDQFDGEFHVDLLNDGFLVWFEIKNPIKFDLPAGPPVRISCGLYEGCVGSPPDYYCSFFPGPDLRQLVWCRDDADKIFNEVVDQLLAA